MVSVNATRFANVEQTRRSNSAQCTHNRHTMCPTMIMMHNVPIYAQKHGRMEENIRHTGKLLCQCRVHCRLMRARSVAVLVKQHITDARALRLGSAGAARRRRKPAPLLMLQLRGVWCVRPPASNGVVAAPSLLRARRSLFNVIIFKCSCALQRFCDCLCVCLFIKRQSTFHNAIGKCVGFFIVRHALYGRCCTLIGVLSVFSFGSLLPVFIECACITKYHGNSSYSPHFGVFRRCRVPSMLAATPHSRRVCQQTSEAKLRCISGGREANSNGQR